MKCQWCGKHYNPQKFNSCPSCGGDNEVKLNELNKDKSNKSIIIIIIILILLCPFILAFLKGFFIGFFNIEDDKIDDEYVYDEYIENDYIDNYDYLDYYFGDMEYAEKIYSIEDSTIYLGNNKINFDYIEIGAASVNLYLETNIKDYEFKDYELELYLITEDGNERRLAETEYSFSGYDDKNIRKLSDVLNFSCSGRIPMQYDLVSIDENYTELEIIINDDSYFFNLNASDVFDDFKVKEVDKEFYISNKIKFGENTFYIDSIKMLSGIIERDFYLNFETIIKEEIDINEFEVFLIDNEGNEYRAMDSLYGGVSYHEDLRERTDAFKQSIKDTLRFVVITEKSDFDKIKILLNGEQYTFELEK